MEAPDIPGPRRAAQRGQRKPAPAAVPPRGKMTILLVEDSGLNREVTASLLQRLGYDFDVASDGVEAVARMEQGLYDLVLMDVQMPNMDGLEATRAIRRILGPRSPYIVAMTGNSLPGDRERCMEAGMDDYLAKPVRLEALANLIDPEHEAIP